jgi:Mce-associated membrane protein
VTGNSVEEKTIETEEADEVQTAGETAGRNHRRSLQFGLVVIAAVVLAVGLVTWSRAADHDADAVEQAELRDAVLITARGHIETMNSLDYRDVEGGLEKWQAVSTGTLRDQLAATDDQTVKLMADQQMISVGKVVDAAIVDLTNNTATVIASVEVTVRNDADPGAEPTVKRNRFAADLVKVGDAWLLETLDQVAVNIS